MKPKNSTVTQELKVSRNLDKRIKRQAIFSTSKPWKAIFTMVSPTIIAVLILSTYQIFDKFIATQWGGINIITNYSTFNHLITAEEAKKIINIATTYAAVPSSMLFAFALLISVGTGVKFSIAYGKNKKDEMSQYVGNGFLMSFVVSIIFMVIMYFACQQIIDFQAGNDNSSDPFVKTIIIKEAVKFSRIFIFATPLLFLANFWVSLLRSEGMVIWTIFITICSAVVNLILDFIFVIGFKLGMEGTAYATVIAWAMIIVIALVIIYKSGSHLKFNLQHLKFKKALIIGILIIGVTSLLQNVAQSLLAMVTTKILNDLPPPDYNSVVDKNIPVYVQLYGGIMPWLVLINAPIIGITQGARSLVGYVYGSKDYHRVWQLMWRLAVLLLVLLVGSLLLVVFFGQYMMHMFGVDLAMAHHFKIYIIMQFAFYPLASLHYIAVIFYQSSNRGKTSLFASLQRTIIMPIICLVLGYCVAKATGNGFYFYLFVGFIDLFAAFVLIPMLGYTLWKSKPFINISKDNFLNQEDLKQENLNQEDLEINFKKEEIIISN